MKKHNAAKLNLHEIFIDSGRQGETVVVQVKSGFRYRIVRQENGAQEGSAAIKKKKWQEKTDDSTPATEEGVIAVRHGADLQLHYADGGGVTLADFYRVCSGDQCGVELPGPGEPVTFGAQDPSPGQGNVVYAHGSTDQIHGLMQELKLSDSGLSGLAYASGAPPMAAMDDTHFGMLPPLLPILGGAMLSNGPSVNNVVSGRIVAGPLIEGHQLRVFIFAADGVTQLAEVIADANGRFSVELGSYTGVVIARVIDGGEQADYLDEATGEGKDLNAALSAMGVIQSSNSTLTLNINALTTIAHNKALEAAGGMPPTAALADASNAAVAGAFGIQDLHATAVVTTNGASGFDSSDGLSDGEAYGAILAALSGADLLNGGNSQATIDALSAGIQLGSGTAALNDQAQEMVLLGAAAADPGLVRQVAVLVDTIPPTITSDATATAIDENSGAGQVVYTATSTDTGDVATGSTVYSLKADNGDDAALFSIDSATGEVTLTGDPNH